MALDRGDGGDHGDAGDSATLARMDYLFTPWRYQYITTADKTPGCIFCEMLKGNDDEKTRIVFRGQHCFVVLNTFPYTSGHVMVVPFEHSDRLDRLPKNTAAEMFSLTRRSETVLRELYQPDGINLGMNIG